MKLSYVILEPREFNKLTNIWWECPAKLNFAESLNKIHTNATAVDAAFVN